MTRPICAICVLCLCNLCLPLAAQSIRYEGLVVNHGAAAAPSDSGISASLQLTIIRDSTAPLGAEVVIGLPLQGSGPASLWVIMDYPGQIVVVLRSVFELILQIASCAGDAEHLVTKEPLERENHLNIFWSVATLTTIRSRRV